MALEDAKNQVDPAFTHEVTALAAAFEGRLPDSQLMVKTPEGQAGLEIV